MKRILSLFLILALLLTTLSLFGCGKDEPTQTPDEPSDEPSDEPEASDEDDGTTTAQPVFNRDNYFMTLPPPTDYVDDEAYARATAYNHRADLTMLQSVMNRAKAGEDITLATIGGSITAGTASSDKNKTSYSAIFCDWWEETFPEASVTLINAGIGATTSYLGVHRVQEDVIDKGADLCIIEFSVNDYTDGYYTQTYESLIARLLANDVAVLLLFMVKETGDSSQAVNCTSGIKLGVPMISYGDAVMPLIEAGEMTWQDISPDNIHPNDRGHAIAGELIYEYLCEVFSHAPNEVTPTKPREELLTQTYYFNSYLLDNTTLEPDVIEGFEPTTRAYSTYKNGWQTTDGGVIEFTATFSRMGAMYRKTIDGKSGKCQVYVDGELVGTLDGDYTGGWGDYERTDQFYSSRRCEEHTVRLVVEDGKAFTLIQFLLSE